MRCGFIIADTPEEIRVQGQLMIELGADSIYCHNIPQNAKQREMLIKKIQVYGQGSIIMVISVKPLVSCVEDFIKLINEMNIKKLRFTSVRENIDNLSQFSKQTYKILEGANEIRNQVIAGNTDYNTLLSNGLTKVLQGIQNLDKQLNVDKRVGD